MRIPLIDFENCIDPSILKRGKSYFNEGYVTRCEEIDTGRYEAVVAGTEDYLVQLIVTDGVVVQYICDCPYDLGPVCKHVAAVIFHIKQDEPGRKKPRTKGDHPPKKAKRKTIADRVNDLLEKVPHNELKQFIREKAQDDRLFRDVFLSSFAHLGNGEPKAFYISQIKSLLRSVAGRHGFIDWRGAGRVGAEISRLLDVATKQMNAGSYLTAVNICTAVMEQLTEALQYGDDSNGDLGENVYFALELLQEIAETEPPGDVRSRLRDYCLTAFDTKIYKGWDWHFAMLEMAATLIRTEADAQAIFERLETAEDTYYEIENAEVLTYEILKKVKGPEVADHYLAGHILNPRLRGAAIENAINKKQYDQARSLARDGIKQHREKSPGLVVEWNEWLLKTAQAEENAEEIIKYARLLFIDSYSRQQDYYALMQKQVGRDDWPEFVEGLIRDLTLTRLGDSQLPGIFIKEAMWERLLGFVKQSPSFYKFDAYEQYLKKDHSSELADMYADAVIEYLADSYNVGRDHYQKACRYIRRIKKLGSPERVDVIVADLRAKYPRRTALLEELEMI